MTGTSADGLDVAVVDLTLRGWSAGGPATGGRSAGDPATGGGPEGGDELVLRLLDHRELAFPADLTRDLLRLLEPHDVPLALVSGVDARLGRFCADAVAHVLEQTGAPAELVVSHGQTVRHDVDGGRVTGTLQLGQPAWIAERTGVPVLSDVRSRDVAAGGQGAPLVGILDHLLLAGVTETTAALNLGGIANLTVVGPGRGTVAYDTGPANALIDVMARRITGGAQHYDTGGALAARGRVLPGLLDALLAEPYYARPAPRSTGKELFSGAYLDAHLAAYAAAGAAGATAAGAATVEADPHDVVATLVALTARTVADQCRAQDVRSVLASGGGTRNPELMAALRRELGDVPLGTTDRIGLPEGAKEACLMALVGWLTWHGLPATLPGVTGADHPTVAGRITPGAGPLRLASPLDALPSALRVEV
ncbi:anhydro-N-acetylmuramic acid kinase [Isoptericola sp. NEAU-Y5]|uniref:Anhydro-N-acetylmuramic acid kinase n=1 Tax=Isoptericola luteus TaxID=2879484 RepID=A0ABS7ZJJ2_9MICO|nr:anhydro-N-acetylmuramic acid kinase [Isoptericola sp. NEAU-Y5]MCA5894516.1 anhydro-N-acetylmuramic acid kinase [Isoptericola sp. NEAU-Y5]